LGAEVKYFLLAIFALVFAGPVHAIERVTGDDWRWMQIGGVGSHWSPREGIAKIEMKDGNILAKLMLDGDDMAVYNIRGTYRLSGTAALVTGALSVQLSMVNSDYDISQYYTGTYQKILYSGPPIFPPLSFSEAIILSNGEDIIGLLKETH
jgi:hypothetical protein